jgi:hypothetical protein
VVGLVWALLAMVFVVAALGMVNTLPPDCNRFERFNMNEHKQVRPATNRQGIGSATWPSPLGCGRTTGIEGRTRPP